MVAGDLVKLTATQTSGYENGTIGLIMKIEEIRPALEMFWILMPDGNEVPLWRMEFELLNESRRFDNNN